MNKEIERALLFILQTEQGRLYLAELLDFCGLYKGSFTGNSETYYKEGMRNVGLKIMADMAKVDPNSYINMMIETKNRKERKEKEK